MKRNENTAAPGLPNDLPRCPAGINPCDQCVARDETGRCCGYPRFAITTPDIVPSPRWEHHGVAVGGLKSLVLGVASTGAKFTPHNHPSPGDAAIDRILRGEKIPVGKEAILREMEALVRGGVRYFHWHPRNPATREQSCDLELCRDTGLALRSLHPGVALSYGASRNGPEIRAAIAAHGEWVRIRQAALPLHEGGAEFVTSHAAAELTVIMDLERQGYVRLSADGTITYLKPIEEYLATQAVEPVSIEANSTAGGADYGSSSAAEQLRVLARAVAARNRLGLPQEVEWTQVPRSYALTRLLLDHFKPGLGGTGRLNVTILFGFSPKLPFPSSYEEFRRVVGLARSLAGQGRFPAMHLTITVSAAVLPQKAHELTQRLDVGLYRGVKVTALERLVAYACQPDSDIEVLRFGAEDHPFLLDRQGAVIPATNVDLMNFTLEMVDKHEGRIVTDPIAIRHFISTETRPYAV